MSKPGSFEPPMESEWHRMISEAANFLAEKRDFEPGRTLSDWLEAELQVKKVLAGDQNASTHLEEAHLQRAAKPRLHSVSRRHCSTSPPSKVKKLAHRERAQGWRQLRPSQKLPVPVPHGWRSFSEGS
jgi:hypothetical protein